MTKQELDHHLELVQQLEDERKLLASLLAAAGPGTRAWMVCSVPMVLLIRWATSMLK